MDKEEPKAIINKILDKVKSGQIKMRPSSYFVLKTILAVAVILIVAASVLFLISLIFFNLKASGVWYLPRFGFPALGPYIRLLPWVLILAVGVLVLVLEVLAKRFSFVYKRPLVYSLIAIALLVFMGSFILDKTPLHLSIFSSQEDPLKNPFYRDIGMMQEKGIYRGTVLEILEQGFTIETLEDSEIEILIDKDTKLIHREGLEKEDSVVVFGEEKEGKVRAKGVLEINDNLQDFPPFRFNEGPAHWPPES
jgi:low affinity Fe/Cu permease